MKNLFLLPTFLILLIPTTTLALTSAKVNRACESFAAGEIDAYQTLEALDLDINNYSIGINNTAKVFCA